MKKVIHILYFVLIMLCVNMMYINARFSGPRRTAIKKIVNKSFGFVVIYDHNALQKVIFPDSILALPGKKSDLEIKKKGEGVRVENTHHIIEMTEIRWIGGGPNIDKLYKLYDENWRIKGKLYEFDRTEKKEKKIDKVINYPKGNKTNVELVILYDGELKFKKFH